MKEYKLVQINKKLKWTRDGDLDQATETLNQYAAQGWELQQIMSPNDLGGAIIAVLFREKEF